MIPLLGSPETLTSVGDTYADAVDTGMKLLSNRRRRAVLTILASMDGFATLPELAIEIATQENSSEPSAISDHETVSPRNRRAVQISLHHTHVPQLASANAVDYDAAAKTVTLTDHGRTLLSRRDAVSGSPQHE
ncbi:DUF7344 domain-containing protein [Natrinema halophilum]|uniref:DUF7344 domain-containing protein n=1 Tax=Natrinema halophilum TaxID=1699371 RepID=A0A7D5K5F9_9EURY|nr:hypothetical protein [Natrinema halophilum]QLG48343.1 hypothetical protein HYG82_05505 [Natrinema halophilum]